MGDSTREEPEATSRVMIERVPGEDLPPGVYSWDETAIGESYWADLGEFDGAAVLAIKADDEHFITLEYPPRLGVRSKSRILSQGSANRKGTANRSRDFVPTFWPGPRISIRIFQG